MSRHQFKLVRFAHTPFGTFGRLFFPGDTQLSALYTVERQWLGNSKDISCIPNGHYPLVLSMYYNTDHPYQCLEVKDVPNRTHIKIHKANLATELAGCIAPGISLGYYKDQWAVQRSGLALQKIIEYVKAIEDEKLELAIADICSHGLYQLPTKITDEALTYHN